VAVSDKSGVEDPIRIDIIHAIAVARAILPHAVGIGFNLH
jgi:hypothetical protein